MTVKMIFTSFPLHCWKMTLKQRMWKLRTVLRILPSARRRPGLLIHTLLGHDTCCCLPSSGSCLVCWPPQDTYSAFCFLIGIPEGGRSGGREGGLKKVSSKCSGFTKQLEPSPPTNYAALRPPQQSAGITILATALNAPSSAAIPPLHVPIDCKPLQGFRPSSKREIQLNQYLISQPLNFLSNASLVKKSTQRYFVIKVAIKGAFTRKTHLFFGICAWSSQCVCILLFTHLWKVVP